MEWNLFRRLLALLHWSCLKFWPWWTSLPFQICISGGGYSTGRGYRTGSCFARDPVTGLGNRELGTGTQDPVSGSGTDNQVTGAGTQNRVMNTGNRTWDLAAGLPESNEQQPLPTLDATDEEDETDQSNNVRFDEIPEGMLSLCCPHQRPNHSAMGVPTLLGAARKTPMALRW